MDSTRVWTSASPTKPRWLENVQTKRGCEGRRLYSTYQSPVAPMSQRSPCRSVNGNPKASFFGWVRLGAGKKRPRKVRSRQWSNWSTQYETVVAWIFCRYSLPCHQHQQFDLAKYTHRRAVLNPGKLKNFNRANIARKVASRNEGLISRARKLVAAAYPDGSVRRTVYTGWC